MLKVGEIYPTKIGGDVEVIEYISNDKVLVKFLDETKYERYAKAGHIRRGIIHNPYKRKYSGVGFVGNVTNPTKNIFYKSWTNMFKRCYLGEEANLKYKTYEEAHVCEDWHNFERFLEWAETQKSFYQKGWHLDKDLIIKNNKVYSPNTCCFLPQEINKMLISSAGSRSKDHPIGMYISSVTGNYVARAGGNYIGVYKTPLEAFLAYKDYKENSFKQVAFQWKGLISDKAFDALYNRKVDIQD